MADRNGTVFRIAQPKPQETGMGNDAEVRSARARAIIDNPLGVYWLQRDGKQVKCHVVGLPRREDGTLNHVVVRLHDTWDLEKVDPADLNDL